MRLIEGQNSLLESLSSFIVCTCLHDDPFQIYILYDDPLPNQLCFTSMTLVPYSCKHGATFTLSIKLCLIST